MTDPTIPGAVDLPGLAPGEIAYRWNPADLYATGWLMGLLSATGTDWCLTGGLGDAAWLTLGAPPDPPTARLGDFIVVGEHQARIVPAADHRALGA